MAWNIKYLHPCCVYLFWIRHNSIMQSYLGFQCFIYLSLIGICLLSGIQMWFCGENTGRCWDGSHIYSRHQTPSTGCSNNFDSSTSSSILSSDEFRGVSMVIEGINVFMLRLKLTECNINYWHIGSSLFSLYIIRANGEKGRYLHIELNKYKSFGNWNYPNTLSCRKLKKKNWNDVT